MYSTNISKQFLPTQNMPALKATIKASRNKTTSVVCITLDIIFINDKYN